MQGRIGSAADRQVIRAARSQGLVVTLRQLERWRAEGAIPKPHQRFLGRGSECDEYEPEALRHVLEAARRVNVGTALHLVVLGLFFDGYPIEQSALRAALRKYFAVIFGYLADRAGTDDRWEQAEYFAKKAATNKHPGPSVRRQKRALRALPPTDDVLSEVEPDRRVSTQTMRDHLYATHWMALTGDTPTQIVTPESLSATASALLGLEWPKSLRLHPEEVPTVFRDVLYALRIDALREGAERWPIEDLARTAKMLRTPARLILRTTTPGARRPLEMTILLLAFQGQHELLKAHRKATLA